MEIIATMFSRTKYNNMTPVDYLKGKKNQADGGRWQIKDYS